MKVGGFGELENIRKALQKEDAGKSRSKPTPSAAFGERSARSDEARVSDQSRMLLARDQASRKVRDIPDLRSEKVKEVLSRIKSGDLMTPEAVKEGIAKMLDQGIVL